MTHLCQMVATLVLATDWDWGVPGDISGMGGRVHRVATGVAM